MKTRKLLFLIIPCSLVVPCSLLAAAPQPTAPTIDMAGAWQIDGGWGVPEAPYLHGRLRPLCVFAQSGQAITGTCKGPSSEGTVEGTVQGNHVRFTWTHYPRPDPVATYLVDGRDHGGPHRDAQGRSTSRVMFDGHIDQRGLIAGDVENEDVPSRTGMFRAAKQ
jgi:hypothetical protein